jgi:hypothetical protein
MCLGCVVGKEKIKLVLIKQYKLMHFYSTNISLFCLFDENAVSFDE